MRGMARLFWRDFNTLAGPSTLWESGHFYFAPTIRVAEAGKVLSGSARQVMRLWGQPRP
jgi:hypothetical protein